MLSSTSWSTSLTGFSSGKIVFNLLSNQSNEHVFFLSFLFLSFFFLLSSSPCLVSTSFFLDARLPFYFLLKLAFLIYLMHPTLKGSVVIYQTFLAPILTKYEKKIDAEIDVLKQKGVKAAQDFSNENPLLRAAAEQVVSSEFKSE